MGEQDGNHGEVAIDRMYFRADGSIKPVVITNEGVKPRLLPMTRSGTGDRLLIFAPT